MNKEFQDLYDKTQSTVDAKPRQDLKIGKILITRGKKEKDYDAVAYGHFVVAYALFSLGISKGLLHHAAQAVAFFRETDNVIMLVRSLNMQGIAYTSVEEIQMSLMSYQEALELVLENKLGKYREDAILNNISACYFELGEKKKAIRIMEKVYRSNRRRKKPDKLFLFNTTYNLAEFHCDMGEHEKALEYCKECERLLEELGSSAEQLFYYIVSTKIYYSIGDCEQGNYWSDKVIEMVHSGVDTFEAHKDYEWIALKQLELSEFDRADGYADYLWDVAHENDSPIDKLRATRLQAHYFDIQGNDRLSLYYYRRMDKINEERNKELLKFQLEVANSNEALVKKMREFRKLMQEKEAMEILASKDSLTGLLNRGALSRLLEHYVELSKKECKTVGCIFIDVDCFKEYNDTYGHLEGDACLLRIADACKSVEEENCYFARYGGDEFFGIMYGFTDAEVKQKALAIAKKVHDYAMMHRESYVSDRITISVGLLNMQLNEESNLLDLVNFSDRALYHSKDVGKNCIYMFDDMLLKKNDDAHYQLVQ